jgi:hypothetical protein
MKRLINVLTDAKENKYGMPKLRAAETNVIVKTKNGILRPVHAKANVLKLKDLMLKPKNVLIFAIIPMKYGIQKQKNVIIKHAQMVYQWSTANVNLKRNTVVKVKSWLKVNVIQISESKSQ